MTEVNFLHSKPVQFPYKQPEKQDPLHCLQALINVHRDSVRLVRWGYGPVPFHTSLYFHTFIISVFHAFIIVSFLSLPPTMHSFFHTSILPFPRSTENEEQYFIAFEFNSDVSCRVSLLSSLPDSAELETLRHSNGSGVTGSHHHLFPRGSEQKFNGRDFPLSPGEMNEESLTYDPENGHDTFPLAILVETTDCM